MTNYDELYHDSIENLQPTFELCWQMLTSIVCTTGATIKHSIHGSSNTQADWLKHLRFVVRLLKDIPGSLEMTLQLQ